ncbi:hypothetical protein [Romboutsia sp.]|uniref:hypothetical protein n=1 Tax=Romboutsia sp. TaxID=1965302 RepID=UPI002B7580EB|nr:hypothetical protein [Romboutsia sp.]HSQ88860.1 hypothetical protein [Romboutsia sp.]
MKGKHIIVKVIVQGVEFRPFIYNLKHNHLSIAKIEEIKVKNKDINKLHRIC